MIVDIITLGSIFVLVVVIAWMYNKEMRISLERSKRSEMSLSEERDMLEKRMSERTSALVSLEKEHLKELERTARFGALSQGLFHDLMNPLSSIALHMEQIAAGKENVSETHEMVQKVVAASKRMKSFMDSVMHSLKSGNMSESKMQEANIENEIAIVKDILGYKARIANVSIIFKNPGISSMPIHPMRLHQILANLITNAIDSYGPQRGDGDRTVKVKISREKENFRLSVEDRGSGMSQETAAKVAKEKFTTKPDGTGTGLMTVYSVVRDELHGTIELETTEGVGTTFTIFIPNK